MSRPPLPHPEESTGAEQTGDLRRLEYLPLEYGDLLALQDELAVTRLGRPRPLAGASVEEADVARTFMELSALAGHVLSVYQRQYAGEAYISTAQAASSLVRHARRLAYDPDPGLAASGYAVLYCKDGVGGTVAGGLPLASVPLGEQKAQDYETHDDLAVDATLNELLPADATQPAVVSATATTLRLQGTGHGIEAGDAVALVGPHRRGFVVHAAEELPGDDVTLVTLDAAVGARIDVGAATVPVELLAHPARTLRPFGARADPALYPPASIRNATGTAPAAPVAPGSPTATPPAVAEPVYWYAVQRVDGTGYLAADVYLSEQVEEPLSGAWIMRRDGTSSAVYQVSAEAVAGVTLHRRAEQVVVLQQVSVTTTGTTTTTTPTTVYTKQAFESHVSATVTAIQVSTATAVVNRSTHPFPADWLADFATVAPLAATVPNPEALTKTLRLAGLHPGLTPGRPLCFSTRDEASAEIVTVQKAELLEGEDVTEIEWAATGHGAAPAGGWTLADLKVLGNVVRVSHGRTVTETLGGSDGVTAFQRFTLGEAPLTILAGVAGGAPELEVRVDDVLWERVTDFAASGPDDRHYRAITDEELVTTVVFGDGRDGAVPPSGRKNVAAVYRVGLGRAGDVEPGSLSRLKRAHPLLDHVANATPIFGGAEPAGADAIRTQSTRWIRTFDRAVSVADLADLALTMPGIARSAARWDATSGAVLVVATAAGEAPAALDAVHAFLDARRDVGVPLVVRGPDPLDVFVDVSVDPDPAYLPEIVRNAIRDALHGAGEPPGMFTFAARELGQPAFRSEVYERLEALAGVIGLVVTRFTTTSPAGGTPPPTPPVANVIAAAAERWLRLEPNNLVVTVRTP